MIAIQKPLTVLNASAGSGKTFNLVRQYLRLLLTDPSEKAEISELIAMTFTNKAALEMKTRIVGDLYKLSRPAGIYDSFQEQTALYFECDVDELRQRAQQTLRKLLHRYEDFNVLTIDKFNLRLIRSFSKDLNLPERFEVVVDENAILNQAVDELLSTIDGKDKNAVYYSALAFSKEALDTDKKPDLKRELLKIGGELKSERAFQVVDSLNETEINTETRETFQLELKQLFSEFAQLNGTCANLFHRIAPVQDDFKGKSRTFPKIVRLLGIKNTDDLFQEFPWSASFENNIRESSSVDQSLIDQLLALSSWYQQHGARLFELNVYVTQFHLLRLLKELSTRMNTIREHEAIIRISEFNQLVSNLLKNEEAPFIYERLGNRLKHFFLDEFQDTSRLQWINLVPLLHESLAQEKFNLIVGDPKQSIYRFKNGVAEQFVSLPAIFNPENDERIQRLSQFFNQQGQVYALEENWRSRKNIVSFNNTFFERFVNHSSFAKKEHYNQIAQQPRGKDGGYVYSEFHFEKMTLNDECEFLMQSVKEAIEDGYQPGDICVLAFRRAMCSEYAEELKRNGFQVVSTDSLRVDADATVRLFVSYLKWRYNPTNVQRCQLFATNYFQHRFGDAHYSYISQCFERTEASKVYFSIDRFFEVSGLSSQFIQQSFSSIYGLLQETGIALGISFAQSPYLQQLLDLAYTFDNNNGPDLMNFIEEYENSLHKSNVSIPENEHAIKVMTAHKSKGLEFPVVILPNLRFKDNATQRDPILVQTKDHFMQTKLTEKDTIHSQLAEMREEESFASFMDCLNLLYVAFTRPEDRLYFFCGKSEGNFYKELGVILSEYGSELGETNRIQIGERQRKEAHSTAVTANNEHITPLGEHLWYPEISFMNEQEKEESSVNRSIRLGKLFHAIMEKSNTPSEAENLLKKAKKQSHIDAADEERLLNWISNFYAQTDIQAIIQLGTALSERTLAIDEKTILRPDKIIITPDREAIVIDFKTGELQGKHQKQILEYGFALQRIGYTVKQGYLYYSEENVLKKVVF